LLPIALAVMSQTLHAQMTALPASAFTDSVGINLHLEYKDTYYYSRQSVVEAALKELRIRHVRTRLLSANPSEQTTETTNSNDTNTAALLSRAGVKGVLTGTATIGQLYADTTDRIEANWADNFTANFDNADSAQRWWNTQAPGTTRIAAVEGVNEPNLARGGFCTNWMSKAADFQWRMHTRVMSSPYISSALRVAPSLVHSSASLCKDSASQNPFVYLGRKTEAIGQGFSVAWNANWTPPSSSDPVSAWFTAGQGSLASTVQVSNLHVYPPVKDTPESSLEQIFWMAGGIRKCGPPASPNEPDPSKGATGFSCAEHLARSQANGQRKPIYVTEAGYAVASNGVSEHSRGVFIPRMLLSNFKAGYARTYIYELMKGKPTQTDGFWLITSDGPQAGNLAYHAVRRLLTAIGDGSLPTGTEANSSVNISVTELGQPNVPADPAYPVRSLLFAERNGGLSLALWPTDKVASGTADITPPERRVRITLGGAAKSFTLYPIDPQSTVPIETGQLLAAASNQVDVVLTGGHAVVVKLR
jgi:hypothetical protein